MTDTRDRAWRWPSTDLPPVTAATAPRLSQLAVAAFVLTFTGAALVSVPLAVWARARIRDEDPQLYGEELAAWALWVGVLVLVLEVLYLLSR